MPGRRSWMAAGYALVAACSSTNMNGPSSDDAGTDAFAVAGDASDSSTPETVTQTVGAAGGTVHAQGLALTIPSGALTGNVTISVTPTATDVPSGYVGLSPVFHLEPAGTVLLTPATIELALATAAPSGTSPAVFLENSGGGYDALLTTVTASSVSASIRRLDNCFAGIVAGGDASTADAAADDGGTNETHDASASEGTDTSPTEGNDASANDAAGLGSDSSPSDASTTADTSANDGGAIEDAGASDVLSTDASDGAASTDSAVGDAGINGIVVTIDGVVTTFATNPQASLSGPDTSIPNSIIQADEYLNGTHWHLQLIVTSAATQSCVPFLQPNYPQIIYTHYTGGTLDATFSTHAPNRQGTTCSIALVGSPAAASGDHARGTFSGTVYATAADAGTAHVFTIGSYDETIP